jgi:hypothetical protein
MASTLPEESSAHPADEAQALRDQIEQTREDLGDTVEQLAAKADVRKQARAAATRLGEQAEKRYGPGPPRPRRPHRARPGTRSTRAPAPRVGSGDRWQLPWAR